MQLLYDLGVPLLGTKPREMETCSHKNLYVNVPNNQKMETSQMSINRWMDEQNVVSPCNEVSFIHKTEWTILIYVTTWKNLENIMQVKEARHEKSRIIWFHLHEVSRTGKSTETESELMIAYGFQSWK